VADREVEVTAKWYRKVIGRVFHTMVSLLAVSDYRDTQCGFKLFRGSVAQDLFSRMRMDGFSFDVEVLTMAGLEGYTVAEVPVNWTHQPGSRVNLALDSLAMLRDLFVIRVRLVRGEYGVPHLAPVGGWAVGEAVDSTPPRES
jgi:dolichyl-phosphate beta-glucosyltransferase